MRFKLGNPQNFKFEVLSPGYWVSLKYNSSEFCMEFVVYNVYKAGQGERGEDLGICSTDCHWLPLHSAFYLSPPNSARQHRVAQNCPSANPESGDFLYQ